MSNVTIVKGDELNIDLNVPAVSGISVVSEPTSTVSVAGIVAGKDSHFTYTQVIPSATWDVTHNLNKKPSVTVVDSADSVVIGDVQYLNNNEVRLTFVGAFSGKAYFN